MDNCLKFVVTDSKALQSGNKALFCNDEVYNARFRCVSETWIGSEEPVDETVQPIGGKCTALGLGSELNCSVAGWIMLCPAARQLSYQPSGWANSLSSYFTDRFSSIY